MTMSTLHQASQVNRFPSLSLRSFDRSHKLFEISVLIIRISSLLPFLAWRSHGLLPLEHITPRLALLTLPSSSFPFNHSTRPRVFIPRIRLSLKSKARLDRQSRMSREILDVPERIWLGFEERDDDGAVGSEGWVAW